MALDTFNPYLFVSAGEQSNKYLTPTITNGIAQFQAQRAQELTGLTVRIDPIQEGTGDPSPDNIRPISGRTGMKVTAFGVNVWDEEWRLGTYNATTGEYAQNATNLCSKNDIGVKPNTSYYFSTPKAMYIFEYAADGSFLGYTTILNNVYTTKANTAFIRFYLVAGYGTTYANDISINYPSTDTTYHAYTGHTYPISWQTQAGTVYGGTLDVVSGVLTVTDALIASYDGETLPSTWISDRDVYAEGTTPTTGAQVVYKLATPQTYRLTGAEVRTIPGFNQIYSDAGPVIDIKF